MLLDFFQVSDGQMVRAHKLVLSACSPMFRTMLKKNDHPNPMVFLHGVRYNDIKAILNFMYRGEVNVNQVTELKFFYDFQFLQTILI
jgi:hypothetical protein